jgi:hypothetical protein
MRGVTSYLRPPPHFDITRRRFTARMAGVAPMLALSGIPAFLLSEAHGQTQAVPGYVFREGQSEYPTCRIVPNAVSEFVRGVDVWEDGLVWSVAGIGAPSGGTLQDCTGASVLLHSAMPGSLPPPPNYVKSYTCISTTLGNTWGGYSPTKMWPTDLACEDPQTVNNGACGLDVVRAVAVGGWKTEAPPVDQFESSEETPVLMSACTAPSAEHSWLRVWTWQRPLFNAGEWKPEFTPCAPVRSNGLVTFFALNNGDHVRLHTVDTLVNISETCIVSSIQADPSGPAIVTAGSFKGQAQFAGPCTLSPCCVTEGEPCLTYTSNANTEDGFVALHQYGGRLLIQTPGQCEESHTPILRLGSSGDDAVLSVSYNPVGDDIVVCGYFGKGDLDFDPDCTRTYYLSHSSGATGPANKDLFVASYYFDRVAREWRFNWAFAWPSRTTLDEQAEGVLADISGATYVTGWKKDGIGDDDLIALRIDPPTCVIPCYSPNMIWSRVVPGSSRTRGLDVCVDGIGRPVITGEFNGAVDFEDAISYVVPPIMAGAAGDIPNFTDGFVARLDPDDGKAQWAYDFGGTGNDTSTDVAVCQFNSARLVHGGDFEATVDFDPSPNAELHTAISRDGYVNVFDHAPEDGPLYHVSLLMDGWGDHHAATGTLGNGALEHADWVAQVWPVLHLLRGQTAPGACVYPAPDWFDGRLTFQTLVYNLLEFGIVHPNDRKLSESDDDRDGVCQKIPPITIRSEREARWIADRLESLGVYHAFGVPSTGRLDEALRATADYFEPAASCCGPSATSNWTLVRPYTSAYYRHALFPIYTDQAQSDASFVHKDVRDRIFNGVPGVNDPFIDQLNGIALDYAGSPPSEVRRDDLLGTAPGIGVDPTGLADARIRFDTTGGEWNLGFAAEVSETVQNASPWLRTEYLCIIERMFRRMTVCPSDFDRDGATEPSQTLLTHDYKQFIDAYGLQAIYADWNFDGKPYPGDPNPDPTGWQSNKADGAKFKTGLLTPDGNLPPASCPNN